MRLAHVRQKTILERIDAMIAEANAADYLFNTIYLEQSEWDEYVDKFCTSPDVTHVYRGNEVLVEPDKVKLKLHEHHWTYKG